MDLPRVSYWLTDKITCYRTTETPTGCGYTIQEFDSGRLSNVGFAVIDRDTIVSFDFHGAEGKIREILSRLVADLPPMKS